MSALLDAEIEGARLTQEEILGFCFQLIIAGNDTTTTLIGNGSVLLAQHPDQLALAARAPERIPNAVEEMLRYEPPAQALPRRARRDLELHGKTIPVDARVLLVWAAANLDEREVKDLTFQIDREARGYTLGTIEREADKAIVAVRFPGESEDMKFVCVQDDGWHVSLAFTLTRGMTENVGRAVDALGPNPSPAELEEAMRRAMQNMPAAR